MDLKSGNFTDTLLDPVSIPATVPRGPHTGLSPGEGRAESRGHPRGGAGGGRRQQAPGVRTHGDKTWQDHHPRASSSRGRWPGHQAAREAHTVNAPSAGLRNTC